MHHHKQLLAFSSTNLFKISLFPKYSRHNWTEKVIFLWNLSLIFFFLYASDMLLQPFPQNTKVNTCSLSSLCVVEVGDALGVVLLPDLLLLHCQLLRLVRRRQEVHEGRHTICRNDQTWERQHINAFIIKTPSVVVIKTSGWWFRPLIYAILNSDSSGIRSN